MDAVRRREDEHAEIALRILVRLYDAWPNSLTVRSNAVCRPAARYTGPNNAPRIMEDLLRWRVRGSLGGVGMVNAKLDPEMHARLDEVDEGGEPWIARVRSVLAEAMKPRLGHATEVRDRLCE